MQTDLMLMLAEELHTALGRFLTRAKGVNGGKAIALTIETPEKDPRQPDLPLGDAATDKIELPTLDELADPNFSRERLEELVRDLGGIVKPGDMTAELKQFVRSKMAEPATPAKRSRKKKDAEPEPAAASPKAEPAPEPEKKVEPASDPWTTLSDAQVLACLKHVGQSAPDGVPILVAREALKRVVPTAEGLALLVDALVSAPIETEKKAEPAPEPEKKVEPAAPAAGGLAEKVIALAKEKYGFGGELYNHWVVAKGQTVPAAYKPAQELQKYFTAVAQAPEGEAALKYFKAVGCAGQLQGKCVTCPFGAGQIALCGVMMDGDMITNGADKVASGELLVRVKDPKFTDPAKQIMDPSVGKAEIETVRG